VSQSWSKGDGLPKNDATTLNDFHSPKVFTNVSQPKITS